MTAEPETVVEPVPELGPTYPPGFRPTTCLICGKDLFSYQMSGHIAGHQRTKTKRWDTTTYAARFEVDRAETFEPKPHTPEFLARAKKNFEKAPTSRAANRLVDDSSTSTTEAILMNLNAQERSEYKTQYDLLFQQIEQDETQIALIEAYCLTTIRAMRYRKDMLARSYAYSENKEKSLKDAEIRLLALGKALGIDRESKLKNRESIRSTVGNLLADYMNELLRSSTPSLLTAKIDEEKMLRTINERIHQELVKQAPEMKAETKDAADGLVPDLAEIKRRAGIDT